MALPLQTTYRPRTAVDLGATVGSLQRGPGDPSQHRSGGVIWRASRTPAGVATIALAQQPDGSIRAAAWGAGREWALAQVPALCGAHDDTRGFDATLHPTVAQAAGRRPGMRIARTDLVFDAFTQAVLEQKVTVRQAFGAWRRLVTWQGDRAPGPTPRPLFAPPAAEMWGQIPSWTWHRAAVEPPQSKAIVAAARRPGAVERAARSTTAAHSDPLTSFAGIGPWTSAETRIRAFGDPDAVSVGDIHLAHEVGYALTGQRTDDAGMLELLEPWRGQRQRVIRLLRACGPREPRRAPRLHMEDHRAR